MKASIKKIDRPRTDKNVGMGLETIVGLIALAVVLLFWFRGIFRPKRAPTKYIDSRGYVVLSHVNELEHRYIAKQTLRRDLEQNEIVHHINGQKTDNRIWNLCLMDKEKHEHFHSWLRWKKEKSGVYPSITDQKRVLEKEYGGTLLENLKSPTHSEPSNAQLYLLHAQTPCWKCKEKNVVVALGVEPNKVSPDDFPFFVLSNLIRVPKDIYGHLCRFTPRYKVAFSREANTSYFMNHCEKCDAPFGDAYLHQGITFSPNTEADAKPLKLVKLNFPVYYRTKISGNGEYQRSFDGFECGFHNNELIWKFSERDSGSQAKLGWKQPFRIRSGKKSFWFK